MQKGDSARYDEIEYLRLLVVVTVMIVDGGGSDNGTLLGRFLRNIGLMGNPHDFFGELDHRVFKLLFASMISKQRT